MEDNSFIPLDPEAATAEERRSSKHSHRIIKNGNARSSGRYQVQSEQHASGQMNCKPVYTNGRVSAIRVQCTCGCETTIQLEYGE